MVLIINAPLDQEKPYKDGNPVYTKFKDKGKYIVTDQRKDGISKLWFKILHNILQECTAHKATMLKDIKAGGEVKGNPIEIQDEDGKTKTIYKPTFIRKS